MNLPLFLTSSRVVLALATGTLLMLEGSMPFRVTAAASCFVIAAVTDFFDGRIARARKQTTSLGAFLDPLADKLLVYLSFIYLATVGVYPVWVLLALFTRDIAVDSLRGFGAGVGVSMPANMAGKWKSFFQMTSIGLLLCLVAVTELQASTEWGNIAFASVLSSVWFERAFGITYWLMVIAAAVGLVSMAQYFVEYVPRLFRLSSSQK